MSVVKALLLRIGHLLISIVRALRKAICCRRKKEPEYLLPMTIDHTIDIEQRLGEDFGNSEFKSQWDAWPENNTSPQLNNGGFRAELCNPSLKGQGDDYNQEDFFKDMVPQIRKQKKLYIKSELKDLAQEKMASNRLAMDPKAIFVESDLGIIDDNPSNWEDSENLDELWDPDLLIREKKRAEQEQRRAEHQRRKLEKENKRSSKPESLSSKMISLSDSKDKHKNCN